MPKSFDVVPTEGFLKDLREGSSGTFSLLCRKHFLEAYRGNGFDAWSRYDPVTEEEYLEDEPLFHGTLEEVNSCDYVDCTQPALFEVYDLRHLNDEERQRPAQCPDCEKHLVLRNEGFECVEECGYKEEV